MKNKKFFPIIENGKFQNPVQQEEHSFLSFMLPSFYMLGVSFWQRQFEKADVSEWFVNSPLDNYPKIPTITWIGHATFLVQIGGLNIITDPIFGNPSSLFRRTLPPGIPAASLPSIDAIIISHNHRDHLDEPSIKALAHHEADILVPEGLKSWCEQRNFTRVTERSWWQEHTMPAKDGGVVTITFLPAQHWSQRGLFDRNKSLWGSWLIEYHGYRIYFAGDTAYADHFRQIGQEFGHIDVALLPVGPCHPHKWMKQSHVNADQAGQAFIDLQAQHFVPMHWGTFYFGVDHFLQPIEMLQQWWHAHKTIVLDKSLHIVKVGQPLSFIPHQSYLQKVDAAAKFLD